MRILLIVAMALGLATGGCTALQGLVSPSDVPVNQTLPAAAQQAQRAINEANILITASAKVVRANFDAGIYTVAQKDGYAVQLRNMASRVDDAQALLRAGDFASAEAQAKLLERALLALHKEVAAKARTQ